jgi:myo-inositol-hexaphosphate 3-phosphohydrolase
MKREGRSVASGALAALVGLSAGLLAGCGGELPVETRIANAAPAVTVTARGETEPVGTVNADAADDPAIWRDPGDPLRSLIVGTDKKAGLYVYGLDGAVKHFVDAGSVNNVDLLADVPIAGGSGILVVASDRNDLARAKLALFRLDPVAATLTRLGTVEAGDGEAYGVCLFRDGGRVFAFSVLKSGAIHQVELLAGEAAPSGRIVRSLKLGSQSEGCVVDPRTRRLYVAEEDVGLWRFDAAADGAVTPVPIARADGRVLVADAEGVALMPEGRDGGHLVVSSQGDNAYAVFSLPDERFVGRFRIGAGKFGSVEETDGIDAAAGDFGPGFPGGLFVAQDGQSTTGAQNFKLVAWADIRDALSLGNREWLAGDHHIHSEFSADYEADPANPAAIPRPLFGKDGRYPIARNAAMARHHGLDWMVSTDHGGPDHARINHDLAHPALVRSRGEVPEVLQFFGMEFDTPGGDHSSLIIPGGPDERARLREIESGFSTREAHPLDPARDAEPRMLAALDRMSGQPKPPVLIANHPSRSAPDPAHYGRYSPREFRDWNDRAPAVAVGMEGAPGHQASALTASGAIDPAGKRGGYRAVATMGGFDPMTARLGGLWDSMLGEGRRWWITATSDSHAHWRDGGNDFWPGEYSKTYVLARRDAADILDGLRSGRVFVTTGDLVEAIDLSVAAVEDPARTASLGGRLEVAAGTTLVVTIRVQDPAGRNPAGREPAVDHIDLIGGDVTGPAADRDTDRNPTTRVLRRFTAADWVRDGEWISASHRMVADRALYLRLRGTNTTEGEPAPDPAGEDPWSDLWFYTNPVFIEPRPAAR